MLNLFSIYNNETGEENKVHPVLLLFQPLIEINLKKNVEEKKYEIKTQYKGYYLSYDTACSFRLFSTSSAGFG